MTKTCNKAPNGHQCTHQFGHKGPCAAVKIPKWKQLLDQIGNAIGEAKFGG